MKRFLKSFLMAFVAWLLCASIVLAAWEYMFPITVVDTSGSSRAYYPVLFGFGGESLVDAGKIAASGLDTNMQIGSTDINYTMAMEQVTGVIPNLPSSGQATPNLYTGFAPPQTNFPMVPGEGGYVTVPSAAPLEPGNNFEIEQSGYIETTAGSNKNLHVKAGTFWTRVSDLDDGTIESEIYDYTDPIDVSPVRGAWNVVDVSNYVPPEATGVIVHLVSAVGVANVRMNGSGDNRLNTLGSNGWTMVGIDANDRFETYLATVNEVCYLVGYVTSDYHFNTNAIDISLGAGFAAWTEIDLTAQTSANAVGVIIEVENVAAGARNFGFKMNGSGDNRINTIEAGYLSWAVIGCDDSQKILHYAQDTNINAYLVGYVEGDDTIFNTDGDDISLGGIGAWTDIDCSAIAPYADYIIIEVIAAAAGQVYGLQENGSAENIFAQCRSHYWGIVKCDDLQVIEGYINNVGVDFFVVGYIRDGVWPPGVKNVRVTGVPSGLHTVTVTATGGGANDFTIDVDSGAFTDTTGLDVATVPVGGDWTIDQNNVMSYMDYYIETVNAVEVLEYQPATMLQALTVADANSYPSIITSNSNTNGSGVAHTINLPTGVGHGNLLIAVIATSGTPTVTFPSDWTQLFSTPSASNTLTAAYKVAIGNEGTGISVTTSLAATSSCQCYRIVNYQSVPTAGTAAVGAAAINPDPPNLVSGWGAVNTLWLALAEDSVNITAYPANYTGIATNGTTPYLSVAYRQLTAANEDPGVFTAVAGNWVANTVAVEVATPAELLDLDVGDGVQNGVLTWGYNTSLSITYGEMVSFEDYTAAITSTGGYTMPSASMPSTWFGGGGNVASLPFYDAFSSVAAQTGQPVQMLYALAIIGVAFGVFIGIVVFTRSALMGYIAMVAIFGIGASMTVIPGWIVFVLIIVGAGIMYLYRQVAY